MKKTTRKSKSRFTKSTCLELIEEIKDLIPFSRFVKTCELAAEAHREEVAKLRRQIAVLKRKAKNRRVEQ